LWCLCVCAVWWYPRAQRCGVCVCVQYGGILVHCVVVFVCVCSMVVSSCTALWCLCVCTVWWYPRARHCGVCVCVQYGGILVHCVVHENYVRITFKHYTPGSAPVLIINHTKLSVIEYWQRYLPLALSFDTCS